MTPPLRSDWLRRGRRLLAAAHAQHEPEDVIIGGRSCCSECGAVTVAVISAGNVEVSPQTAAAAAAGPAGPAAPHRWVPLLVLLLVPVPLDLVGPGCGAEVASGSELTC